jgi:hypothetical protein
MKSLRLRQDNFQESDCEQLKDLKTFGHGKDEQRPQNTKFLKLMAWQTAKSNLAQIIFVLLMFSLSNR